MKRYKFRTYLILTLLWLAFVLLQGLLPGDVSSAESSGVLALVNMVIPWLTHSVLRSAAHFLEYLLLGFLMTGAFCNAKRFTVFKPAFCCVLTALLDETCQLHVTGRSGQFSDVWLDVGGAAIGIALMWLISAMKKR